MSPALLALRERARRWWGRTLVKVGANCPHTLDPKAWRPCSARIGPGQSSVPGRVCRYCDALEELTDGDYYAAFGVAYFRRRA